MALSGCVSAVRSNTWVARFLIIFLQGAEDTCYQAMSFRSVPVPRRGWALTAVVAARPTMAATTRAKRTLRRRGDSSEGVAGTAGAPIDLSFPGAPRLSPKASEEKREEKRAEKSEPGPDPEE
jgi:hypothetical protein